MTLSILSVRATVLSTLLEIVVMGSVLSMLTVVFGTIFRRTWLWRIAVAVISATLFAAVGAAILDHLGYAH